MPIIKSMTVTKFDTAYTKLEIEAIVAGVEDHLLSFRKIRVEPELVDAIVEYLFNAKYTPAQFSLAKLWIEKGAWAISKKELSVSDFYPTQHQMEFAHDELVTKEFSQRRIMYLKTEFDIMLRNEKSNWIKTYMNKDQIEEEQAQMKQIAEFTLERLALKQKIDSLNSKISFLNKENTRLNNIINRRNENLP